jgi:hypothetical protein
MINKKKGRKEKDKKKLLKPNAIPLLIKNKCVSAECKNEAQYNFVGGPKKYFCYEHYKLIESLMIS